MSDFDFDEWEKKSSEDSFFNLCDQLGPNGVKKAQRLYNDFVATGRDNTVDETLVYRSSQEILRFPGLFEKIEELPQINRVAIGSLVCSGMNCNGLLEYLELLSLAGNPIIVLLSGDLENMEDFQESILKASSDNHVYDQMDEEFSRLLRKHLLYEDSFDWYETDIIELSSWFVLRAVYGESLMTELLSRIIEEGHAGFISVGICAQLLKDWANLREYPLKWAVNIVERKEA